MKLGPHSATWPSYRIEVDTPGVGAAYSARDRAQSVLDAHVWLAPKWVNVKEEPPTLVVYVKADPATYPQPRVLAEVQAVIGPLIPSAVQAWSVTAVDFASQVVVQSAVDIGNTTLSTAAALPSAIPAIGGGILAAAVGVFLLMLLVRR